MNFPRSKALRPQTLRRTLLLGFLATWLMIASPGTLTADQIELSFLTGTYTDLGSDLQPVQQGPLTIQISSPEHRLQVLGNILTLTPAADGMLEAMVEVDFEGEGQLVAEVVGGGVGQRFVDQVVAPRQLVRGTATIRLERAEGGYRFTVVEPGPPATVTIQSGVAGQVVELCRVFAKIPFLGVSCDGLEQSLSVLQVPLPEAGKQFLLPADLLNAAERQFFEEMSKP